MTPQQFLVVIAASTVVGIYDNQIFNGLKD